MDIREMLKQSVYICTGMLLLIIAACSDDFDELTIADDGNKMHFSVDVNQDWISESMDVSSAKCRNEGGIDDMPLYIGATAIHGINGHSSDNAPEVLTRGEMKTTSSFHSAFGLHAYTYTGSWNNTQTPNYFCNQRCVNGTGGWSADNGPFYWPSNGQKMKLFAYAPYYASSSSVLSISGTERTGLPVINYTVPSTVTNQQDLMVALSNVTVSDGTKGNPIPLNFKHIMTAIQFKVGNDMIDGTITSIKLKNVKGVGTFTANESSGNLGAWDNDVTTASKIKTFEITANFSTSGKTNVVINSGTSTFMMIPQTLSNDAELEVVFTDDKSGITNRTFTTKLKNILATWNIGTTVTYSLSVSSITYTNYVLNVTPSADGTLDINYNTAVGTFQVQSYATTSGGKTPAGAAITQTFGVGWHVEYYVNGAWTRTSPGWLTMQESTSGSTTVSNYQVTAEPQSLASSVARDANGNLVTFVKTSIGTSASPIDLSTTILPVAAGESTSSKSQTTANCYVVTRPGWYKFPLVYGNAIKNGAANPNSYRIQSSVYNGATDEAKPYLLQNFINHKGEGINTGNTAKDPYIWTHTGCTPRRAFLVWQDAFGLIDRSKVELISETVSNANLGNKMYYIKFYVDPDFLCQGNCILAVTDPNDEVMWSWHIWVTNINVDNADQIINYGGETYNIMPVNLGYCEPETRSYQDRTVQVRIVQDDSGTTSTFTVSEAAAPAATFGGNNVLFQKGKRTPSSGADGLSDEESPNPDHSKPTYNAESGYDFEIVQGLVNNGIIESIKHPNRHYKNGASGPWLKAAVGEYYYNLWDLHTNHPITSLNDCENPSTMIKTVYDPCPPGYMVSSIRCFTGFSATGQHGGALNIYNPYGTGSSDASNFDSNGFDHKNNAFWFYNKPSGYSSRKKLFFRLNGCRFSGTGLFTGYNEQLYYWFIENSKASTGEGAGWYSNPMKTYINMNFGSGGNHAAAMSLRPMKEGN